MIRYRYISSTRTVFISSPTNVRTSCLHPRHHPIPTHVRFVCTCALWSTKRDADFPRNMTHHMQLSRINTTSAQAGYVPPSSTCTGTFYFLPGALRGHTDPCRPFLSGWVCLKKKKGRAGRGNVGDERKEGGVGCVQVLQPHVESPKHRKTTTSKACNGVPVCVCV